MKLVEPVAADFDRVPPSDVAAEQITVGAMMVNRDAIADVAAFIRPRDHYRPAHQIVHEAILALDAAASPVDVVTVADLLGKRGDLAKAGGGDYLHALIASVPVWANAGFYASIVRDKATLRRMIEVGTRITQLGYSGEGDTDELVGRAREEADSIAVPSQDGTLRSAGDLFLEVVDGLEQHEERGIPVPWTDVSEIIGGLAPGEMNVIAARPGVGKSIAGLQIAAFAAMRHKVPSVIFSMEMRRQEIMLRLISAEGRVPLYNLTRRKLSEDHWPRIHAAREKIGDAPLFIDDDFGCTLAHIRSRLRSMARDLPAGLVVVDYLQLLSGTGRAENRQAEVSAFSRGLKLLAGEFDVPVLAISQLNRMPAHRADRTPELSDLRESGAIENDASVVILLHREDAYMRESPRAGEIDFIIAKNRSGPNATSTEAFQGEYARIVDMAPAWTPSSSLGSDAA